MSNTKKSTKLYAMDIPVATPLPLGTYQVSKAEIMEFANMWDPQSFHIDEEVAKDGYFGKVIASGIHTLAILQRLMVTTYFNNWAIIAGKEIEKITFNRPVFPDDTLGGTMVINSMTPDARGRALMQSVGTLTNQHDQVVLTSAMEALVRMRPEDDAS